jgi:spermidine/putrescine transport system permease protein
VPDKEKKPLWNGKTAIVLASFLIVGSVCYTSYLHFASSHSNELYVYNWGEYIDESVIDEFEAETGIHVTYDLFETNEEMYPVIEAGAVGYDAVCPSDYMIQKMVENGLLAEINFENVPNIVNIDPVYLEKSKIRRTAILSRIHGERSELSTMSRSWKSLESRRRRSGRISGMKD